MIKKKTTAHSSNMLSLLFPSSLSLFLSFLYGSPLHHCIVQSASLSLLLTVETGCRRLVSNDPVEGSCDQLCLPSGIKTSPTCACIDHHHMNEMMECEGVYAWERMCEKCGGWS